MKFSGIPKCTNFTRGLRNNIIIVKGPHINRALTRRQKRSIMTAVWRGNSYRDAKIHPLICYRFRTMTLTFSLSLSLSRTSLDENVISGSHRRGVLSCAFASLECESNDACIATKFFSIPSVNFEWTIYVRSPIFDKVSSVELWKKILSWNSLSLSLTHSLTLSYLAESYSTLT